MYGYGYRYNSGLVVGSGGVPPAPFANTKSLSFDGTDNYLDCGNDSSINISGDLTLSAWVFIPLSSPTFYGVFSKIDASTRNYELLIRNNETISFYTSNTEFTTSTSAIPLNTWTHVMVTVESGVAGGVKFYFNGVLDATTGTQTVVAQTYNLNIGRRSTNSFYLNGNIDEPCIFDRVVTPAEIVTLSTAPTVDLTSLNPLAWYRNGDNGSWKSPQWLIPNNENFAANKVSNYSMAFDGLRKMPVGSITLGTDNIVSLWLKRDVTNTQETLLGEISNAFNYFMVITTTNALYLRFGASVYVGYTSAAVASVLNDTTNWINIIVVRSGDSVELFLNGLSMGTGTNNSGLPGVIETKFDEVAAANGSFRTTGAFNNVAAWNVNTVLPSEIFNGGTPPDLSTLSTVPVNWWKMADNSTWTPTTWNVPDEIGTNDGTIDFLDIFGRIGEAPNSENNALSFNMDEVDRTTDVPPTIVPFNTKSLLFTGVDDAVLISAPSALNNTTKFTVSTWFKSTSLVGQRVLWSMGSSASQLWGVSTYVGNFYIYAGSSTKYIIRPHSLVAGTWYNLVLVYDGSLLNADKCKAYLDGTLLTGGSEVGTIPTVTPTFTTDFKIGGLAYSTGAAYVGNVDEFSIFDRVVTPAEITTLSTAPTVDLTSLNPNNWYRNGDGDTYPTITDNGSGGNSGTMTNMDAGDIENNVPN